jgi:hypothetical protein
MSSSNGRRGLYPEEPFLSVHGNRGGVMRRRHRPKLQVEVCLIPSQDGVPAGHPYRHMDEAEREALFVASLVRILRESAGTPTDKPDLPAE